MELEASAERLDEVGSDQGLTLVDFSLNVSAFCGMGGTSRVCAGGVQGVPGCMTGGLGCLLISEKA